MSSDGLNPAPDVPADGRGSALPAGRPPVIRMDAIYRDHEPPHFHATHGGDAATVDIRSVEISSGRLPPRAQRRVLKWARLRQDELLHRWHRAERREPLPGIDPLP